jgi:hypothetical protein
MKERGWIKRLISMLFKIPWAGRGGLILGAAFCLTGSLARAQDVVSTGTPSANSWRNYDWLKPAEDQQRQAASGSTVSAVAGQSTTDPFAVLSTGVLWQEKSGAVYTRRLSDNLSLSCETSTVALSDGPNPYLPLSNEATDLSRGQKAGFQFKPVDALTFSGNVHDSSNEGILPANEIVTSGAGFAAEGHLPFQSELTLGVNSDRTGTDLVYDNMGQSTAYDAQFKQPLGKMPLTAVFKGHYSETAAAGSPAARMPSLEQSLVWKPVQDTTVQMGLRQQHYEDFPGISNEFNEALFADWSQKIMPDFAWHSYAEVLNTQGIPDNAPAIPLASGANGTPQATAPGPSLSSAVPVTLEDKTLTFSTGPSFRLRKDVSASIEYSNRWDQNPLPGSIGQEQRVSLSVKGTF